MTRVEIRWEGETARDVPWPTEVALVTPKKNGSGIVLAEYVRKNEYRRRSAESPFSEPMLESVGEALTWRNDASYLIWAFGGSVFLMLAGVALVIWTLAQ